MYNDEEVAAKIEAEGLDSWTLEDGWLRRKYNTDGWPTTLMLVNAIGYLCEAAWHHADLSVTWGKLWVKLKTHSEGGITDIDFALGEKDRRGRPLAPRVRRSARGNAQQVRPGKEVRPTLCLFDRGVRPVSIASRLKLTRRRVVSLAVLAATFACLPDYLSAYTVSGPSDAPTLLLGDRVIVNHAAYDLKAPYSTIRLAKVGAPQRGDLVSFLVPNRNVLGLKRVVGVPGDTVELRENQLLINGRPMDHTTLTRTDFDWIPTTHTLGTVVAAEEGVDTKGYRITYTPGRSLLRTFGPMTVPNDCFFVLGDHRDNSNDSRTFGPIGRALITGKVVWIMPASRP